MGHFYFPISCSIFSEAFTLQKNNMNVSVRKVKISQINRGGDQQLIRFCYFSNRNRTLLVHWLISSYLDILLPLNPNRLCHLIYDYS